MKISEMTNEQATEAMIRLSGPISSICDDDEAMALIEEVRKKGEAGDKNSKAYALKVVAQMLPQFVAFGLKKHKQDLYEIIGALLMVPVGSVGKMNFAQTVKAVRDSWDDVLASFFTRSGAATDSGGGAFA